MEASISADIPRATVDNFIKAFSRYKDELGNSQAVAVRRGTIALVKSLRARTKAAKKSVALSAFASYDGAGPHYITPKSGRYKGLPLHRFTKEGFKKHQPHTFIYAAPSRSDAWRSHGKITRFKLAKKSWGWFMQKLFGRSAPNDNPNAEIRNDMVDGFLREIVTGDNPRVEVLILNNLDYIRDALEAGALEDSMVAATKSINAQIEKGLAKARNDLK